MLKIAIIILTIMFISGVISLAIGIFLSINRKEDDKK